MNCSIIFRDLIIPISLSVLSCNILLSLVPFYIFLVDIFGVCHCIAVLCTLTDLIPIIFAKLPKATKDLFSSSRPSILCYCYSVYCHPLLVLDFKNYFILIKMHKEVAYLGGSELAVFHDAHTYTCIDKHISNNNSVLDLCS